MALLRILHQSVDGLSGPVFAGFIPTGARFCPSTVRRKAPRLASDAVRHLAQRRANPNLESMIPRLINKWAPISYLLTCLLAYLLAYLFTYLLTYLLNYLLSYLLSYLLAYLRPYLLICPLACLHACMLACLLACFHACLLAWGSGKGEGCHRGCYTSPAAPARPNAEILDGMI